MMSVWSESTNLSSFPMLQGDRKTEVLIIGGGMAGILCAYTLSKAGIDCILAERDRICSGVTENTTAKITSQHGMIYNKLIRSVGIEKAKMYLEANENAVEKYRSICADIDCDFENKDNTVYTLSNRQKAEKEIAALEKLGFKAEFLDKIPVPVDICGAVSFKNQAQFNPLKFVSAIVPKLKIYENSKVIEIRGNKAFLTGGSVTAKYFICTTHFPFMNKYGMYPFKMYQDRSYVLALENGPQINGMYVDEAEKGMSFRNYNNYLLIGGGDHRTGKQGGGYSEIRAFSKIHYPDLKERFSWATQDCMTFDSIPYIGKYSPKLSNVFVATGFNKWGMTSSMVSASILCDMITEKKNEFAPVFSPSRNFLKPKLAVHIADTLAGYINKTPKRCPHMGCALVWNSDEHTWDCPCHGSRFDENGKLLDNPATDDLI